MSRTTMRRGFTLVELLVVIAIIGMLVALLLPAVNAAREAARRLQCNNHLKQLALACRTHQTTHGFFPSGGGPDWTYHMTFIDGAPAVAPHQHGGWGYQVLPYLEQSAVWLGSGATSDVDRSIVAISTPIPYFFCPSRRRPEVVEANCWYHNPNAGKRYGHAKNDYVAGSLTTSSTQPHGVGPITRMVAVQPAAIRDGLSNTLLLGEKRMNVMFLGRMQANDNEGYTCGWNHDTLRYTNRVPIKDFADPGGNPGDDRFGSSHSGSFNIALADGSVRSLVYSVDATVWQNLGDKQDGQSFKLP